jgi:hypothetical protein
MHGIIANPHSSHWNVAGIAWMLPVFIVMLIVAGAIASLLSGLITPDVIGADGLGRSMIAVP